jgi:hypothetical protein
MKQLLDLPTQGIWKAILSKKDAAVVEQMSSLIADLEGPSHCIFGDASEG